MNDHAGTLGEHRGRESAVQSDGREQIQVVGCVWMTICYD